MTIREISKKYSISEDTLRYYEKVGIIRPVKRKNGIRDYGDEELANIEFVVCMRSAGLPIKVLKQYLDLFERGDETLPQRVAILKDQREKIKGKIRDLNSWHIVAQRKARERNLNLAFHHI